MKWASALSEQPADRVDTAEAVRDISALVRRDLDGQEPDLLVVFASPHHRPDFVRLPSLLQREFPRALLVGCTGGGVIGGGHEVEGRPALSLTAAVLPDVKLTPFHFDLDELPEGAAAWHALVDPSGDPSFLLLPDPWSCDLDQLTQGLDAAYPAARKVGGLASGGRQAGGNALFLGTQTYRDGVVGIALAGDIRVDTIVAQGCRPVGTPLIVTRCDQNLIFELSGRPALDVLRELFGTLSPRDKPLFRTSLFLGIEMQEDQFRLAEYRQGDFLIRNLMGISVEKGAIAIAAHIKPLSAVQFHLRDAETSAEDLRQHLVEYHRRGGAPAGALLFSCLGRGEGLYGKPDHDSELFASQLGPVPVGGFFGNGEIGPVGASTFIHGYTSSFGLYKSKTLPASRGDGPAN